MVENATLMAGIPDEAKACMQQVRQLIIDGTITLPDEALSAIRMRPRRSIPNCW